MRIYRILRGFGRQMSRANVNAYAASTAFFLFLSLIPMLMLICSILPYTPIKKSDIITAVTLLPQTLSPLLTSLIQSIYDSTFGVMSIAAIVTVWSAGKGVLALMCDSTNAIRPGFTMSERTVGKTFDSIFAEHKNNRIIVATFASNVDRVQQIINTACKYDRKVVVEGRSMVNIIQVAQELGYLNVPDKTLIEIDQLKNYPPEKMVLITTGSQGESMAALSRMAADVHRKVTIQPNDTIIFSSNPIPGNEKSVSRVINELSAKGAEVIFQDAHVSGHACQEELKLIYSLVKPKYAIPVHGEYRHLKANAGVATSLGIPKENVFIIQSGDVLELCDESAKVVDKVHTGAILVDGLGVGDVGNIVLRDRQHLAEDGIIIVVLTLERRTNRLLAGPDIVSRGFVYVRESEQLMEDARKAVADALDKCLRGKHTDWNKIKLVIRDAMNDYIWKKTKRRPMVIPIIMDVDV